MLLQFRRRAYFFYFSGLFAAIDSKHQRHHKHQLKIEHIKKNEKTFDAAFALDHSKACSISSVSSRLAL